MRVALVSMPFGALERPALGLSSLQAVLRQDGHWVDVRYLTFPFAELIGVDEYQWLSFELPYTAFVGDWTFTRALHGYDADRDAEYVDRVLRRAWQLDDVSVQRLMRIRSLVEPYLGYCMELAPWGEYDVVGFTSTFEQNIASLALAARIKRTWPGIVAVFGGANWEAEMGLELHRRFSFVDYACSGEAEESFPALLAALAAPGERGAADVGGVIHRRDGESVYSGPPAPITDLDALPIPEFEDYFRAVDESTIGSSLLPTLLFEGSRGCWWGAKSHCTFCGLNGGSMAFRSKTASRAIAELDHLTERWKTDLVEAVDNILDMRYFTSVMPTLAQREQPLTLFYEVKSNLTRAQVELLGRAGVRRIQPGIESLSDHVLGLMRKGTTALRNIQLLKWCREYGISAEWNLLYGFPGETREDYERILALLPAIHFLGPPVACGPIRLDRFSPYFDAPGSFGFVDVRPVLPYQYLYPFEPESLARIAYYFDYEYAPGVDPRGYADGVIAHVEEWRRNPERGCLTAVEMPDGALLLTDTRRNAVDASLRLEGAERLAYEYCDQLRNGGGVAAFVEERTGGAEWPARRVAELLDSFVARGLMVTDGTHYLSLAVRAHPVDRTARASVVVLPPRHADEAVAAEVL